MSEPPASERGPSRRWMAIIFSVGGAALLTVGILWTRRRRRHRQHSQGNAAQSVSAPGPADTSEITQAVGDSFGAWDDIAERLRAEFGPCELDIEDMTKPNWDGSPGPPRISLELVSDVFAGLPQSERQQRVRKVLVSDIKSRRIDDYTALLQTPDEQRRFAG
ncbi:unnamed protein product [Prorocentrum cordatum]|uniref:Uncharacterized protein n=1 Tax=Prorocentrum cordatum TaxID=2364126 RepID=A0ABN9TUW8_9DINO|nr:unnamed protein product [Polarella glacialis]|mmetsp:Transcript_77792/g.202687  ORF Transcript_77792/g.202687 Transcript_77792/m.202687 type:complete len:163 (-) Transcript_77792:168-656(-)